MFIHFSLRRLLLASSLIAGAWLVAPSHAADPLLDRWHDVPVKPVAEHADRHVIHSYFNTSPESPDAKYVLFYTSPAAEGETDGDLRIIERATGKETILVTGLHTEDAHRVACQQWSDNGKTVLYHNLQDGHWRVMAVDIDKPGQPRVLAEDRQLGYGSCTGTLAPIYGCHWKPGPHRDLELVNVRTGEIKTVVTADAMAKEYGDWLQGKLGAREGLSIFFPVMSPDESKVFFKPNKPSNEDDYHGMHSSEREGKVVYDLKNSSFIRLVTTWGHPAWTPDSTGISEKANYIMDVATGKNGPRFAPSCFSDHPSISPDGKLFTTDADVSKRYPDKAPCWAVAVGSTVEDRFEIIQMFDNNKGATTWRHNHPHPAFSPDGNRLYFNMNDGKFTRLVVAERKP